MHIAILTFEGYNELDSLIALGVLNRVQADDWRVTIATPTEQVTSMNGVTIGQMSSLTEALAADAVIVGSGIATREVVETPAIMDVLSGLDPQRQLIGAQCSGHWSWPARPLARRAGLHRSDDETVGGRSRGRRVEPAVLRQGQCRHRRGLPVLAVPCGLAHRATARRRGGPGGLHYVAPVGEKDEYVDRAWHAIAPYLASHLQVSV